MSYLVRRFDQGLICGNVKDFSIYLCQYFQIGRYDLIGQIYLAIQIHNFELKAFQDLRIFRWQCFIRQVFDLKKLLLPTIPPFSICQY